MHFVSFFCFSVDMPMAITLDDIPVMADLIRRKEIDKCVDVRHPREGTVVIVGC
jgi:hypothetical protein